MAMYMFGMSAFQWKTPVIAKFVMTVYVLLSRLNPSYAPDLSIVLVYHVTVNEDDIACKSMLRVFMYIVDLLCI